LSEPPHEESWSEPEPVDDRKILEERARALAREPERHVEGRGSLTVLEFDLAYEKYAIELSHIREVHPLRDITPIPCTPKFVRGMVNLRGQILTVLDLKLFFQLPEKGFSDLNKVIVVHVGGMESGILVDAIGEVRSIPLDAMQPSLPTLSGISESYVRGITAEGLVVLDVARILCDKSIIVNDEAWASKE